MLIVLQWFNPAAWTYRSAVRDMHEYLADKGTIQSGYAIKEYQRLLASLAGPVTAGILSNNMKHSTLKNRFTMMTKSNNKRPATLRLALAIVAVALVGFGVFISACQTGSKEDEPENTEREIQDIPSDQVSIEKQPVIENPEDEYVEIQRGDSTYKVKAYDAKSGTFIIVQDQPTFMGGDEARIEYIKENLRYPDEAREKGIQGIVFVTFVVEADGSISNVRLLRGIGGGCDEEAVRVIENMPRWIPGKQRGQAVRVQFNMPIRFTLE
jgi:TonB family protein